MEQLARDGKSGATLTLTILDDISKYLSSCQFGITLASLGIGFLGEPAIAQLLEPLLGDVFSHGVAVVIAVIIAYTVSTALHFSFRIRVKRVLHGTAPTTATSITGTGCSAAISEGRFAVTAPSSI